MATHKVGGKLLLLTTVFNTHNVNKEKESGNCEQHEAIMQTFEVLNSLPSNPTSWPVEQLRQCRNVLLTAIQHSTYGRG
jgi:hypothetical protein